MEYEVSDLGRSLGPLFASLSTWAADNTSKIQEARQAYDVAAQRRPARTWRSPARVGQFDGPGRAAPGWDDRHVDLIWPLWNLLDLTPEGRGGDWRPAYSPKRRVIADPGAQGR